VNAYKFLQTLSRLSFAAVVVSQISSFAQSNSVSRSNYVVSVRDLKMDGKSRVAFDKGSHLLAKGDAAGSIEFLQQAIAEFPEHYKAYYDLGVAYFRLGQATEAEEAFQKAINITGGSFAPPQFGLGALLCQRQDFRHAATILERAVDLEPGSAVGKYYLSWAQFGLNRLIEAEHSAEQALLRNSNLAEAYLLLAQIHQRQQNAPAVGKDLEFYLKVEPNKALAHHFAQRIQEEMAQSTAVTLMGAIKP
jgi:tetratricopeptide (TPR) repeat protein